MQNTQTRNTAPMDLFAAMQPHAEMLDHMLTRPNYREPSGWMLNALSQAVAERTATAYREVERERERANERCGPGEWEDLANNFLVLMAQMNGIAHTGLIDFSNTRWTDNEKHAIPDPHAWYDGLCCLRAELNPYLNIYDRRNEEEADHG